MGNPECRVPRPCRHGLSVCAALRPATSLSVPIIENYNGAGEPGGLPRVLTTTHPPPARSRL